MKCFSQPSVASPSRSPLSSLLLLLLTQAFSSFTFSFSFPSSHGDPGPHTASLTFVSITFSLLHQFPWATSPKECSHFPWERMLGSGHRGPRTGSGWSSPAVDNGGTSTGVVVQPLPEHLPEGQQGVWGVGDAVVRPGHIVELSHGQSLLLLRLDREWVGGLSAQNGGEGSSCRLGWRGVGGSLGHPVVPGICGEGTSQTSWGRH